MTSLLHTLQRAFAFFGLTLLSVLASCSDESAGWKTVTVGEAIQFAIPRDCVCGRQSPGVDTLNLSLNCANGAVMTFTAGMTVGRPDPSDQFVEEKVPPLEILWNIHNGRKVVSSVYIDMDFALPDTPCREKLVDGFCPSPIIALESILIIAGNISWSWSDGGKRFVDSIKVVGPAWSDFLSVRNPGDKICRFSE